MELLPICTAHLHYYACFLVFFSIRRLLIYKEPELVNVAFLSPVLFWQLTYCILVLFNFISCILQVVYGKASETNILESNETKDEYSD